MRPDPSRRLLVLYEGRFGAAVADRLAAGGADRSHALTDALPRLETLVSEAGFVALALWRRFPAATEAVDSTCARLGVPWSAATLEGSCLVIGPVVVPGEGPCHACFRKRWLTHVPHPERETLLDAWYETDATAGCEGFPPAAVGMAAAALAFDRTETGNAAGRLRYVDLLRATTDETRVVRVHGCPRCGTPASAGRRYVDHLREALAKAAPAERRP